MDATRSLITLTCHQCGEPFQRLRYEHAKKIRQGRTKWFCGLACVAASLRTGGRPCMVCGKPTGSNDRRRFYCSPECKATTRPPKREKGCPRCGVVFAYSSTRRVYCSKVCADQAHALRMTGRGNSRYKDGTSYADWFRKMRPLIKERDGNVCRVCSTVRATMVVHHLDERPWNNRATNLIYLCGSCHAVHHKSAVTPFPWFAGYTEQATAAMPQRWHDAVSALVGRYAGTGRDAARKAEHGRVGSSGEDVRDA